MSKNTPQRPISPHIGIYRKQISSVLSILHRLTGCALYVGTAVIVFWLWTAAYTPNYYGAMHDLLASLVGQLLLIGWTVAFYYHFANGIRHLFWDTGRGFTLPVMARSGWSVLLFTLVMTALTWGAIYSGGQ